MRALVIVHERDIAHLQETVLHERSLSADLFPVEVATFELGCLVDGHGRQITIEDASGEVLTREKIAKYTTLVVVAADHAVNNSELVRLLREFLQGQESPDWLNQVGIILRWVRNLEIAALRTLPIERVFHCPSPDSPGSAAEPGSSEWMHCVREELQGLVATIDENQTRNPNVGFGLLLVDQQCNFFLMERLREPGKGHFGTIGGNFDRGREIVPQLATVLKRRFHSSRAPKVDLGPLIACTNMRGSFLHYVDLTFLAILNEGDVSDVSDEELQPVSQTVLSELPRSSRRSGRRFMFTAAEMAVFYRQQRLFAPVANAFESFCRSTFAYQVQHGRHRTVQIPSLVDDTKAFTLTLPSDDDALFKALRALHPFSRTALPFFEGAIT